MVLTTIEPRNRPELQFDAYEYTVQSHQYTTGKGRWVDGWCTPCGRSAGCTWSKGSVLQRLYWRPPTRQLPQLHTCASTSAAPPRCFPCPRAANPANLPNSGAGLPDLGDTHVSAKFTYKMSPIQVRQRGSARLRLLAGGACN